MKVNKWTTALASAGLISGAMTVQAEESPVMTALSSTTIAGYVDTSMAWNPGTGNANPAQYGFNNASKMDGFNLNAVNLQISKPMDEGQWAAGYNVEMLFGPDAVGYNPSFLGDSTSDFALKQAYVTLRAPVGNGLDFKVGVFGPQRRVVQEGRGPAARTERPLFRIAPFLVACAASSSGANGTSAHQTDGIEFRLLARGLFGAFAHLVALVEHLDLLELLKSIGERILGVVELNLELIGRTGEILTPLHGGLGIGRIGKVPRIIDPGAILLNLDFPVQITGHPLKLGNHAFDLSDLAPLLVDLELSQTNQCFARLHRLILR
jgi:hypothetical protein